jgi:type III pantothenate kinase
MAQPLLIFDVGNTHIKCALFDQERMAKRTVFETFHDGFAADFSDQLKTFVGDGTLSGCVIASVVRGAAEQVQTCVRDLWQIEAVVVTAAMNLGICAGVPRPEAVGIDRLLEAAEAFRLVNGAVVVAALGSAVTVDLVSHGGVFRGGTILPGLAMGLRVLHAKTSLLPDVTLEAPTTVLGTDTVACMRAGVVYGMAGALTRIYQELCALSTDRPALVITGGDADLIGPFLSLPYQQEPDLVLRSLWWVYEHRS